ncbi:hypothetical protein SO802_010163 [Lithocarpus litseifolius]|uniref:CCHC-type domain-containing protein n=1 Tax=Lithocarpus litseifolius TaxID=425828 RepID=A0AAW2DJ31_9ROSI
MEHKVILQLGDPNKPIQTLEKPLVKLPTNRQTRLKSKDKTALEIVTQMIEDLKKEPVTPSPSKGPQLTTLDVCTASSSSSKASSKSDKEIEHIESQFRSLEVKKLHHPNPISLTKNWYPRPTPPDLQYEERNVSNQFTVTSGKLYKWNIDGLSEHEILNKIQHLTMVANNYLDEGRPHTEAIELIVLGFTGKLLQWWNNFLTEAAKYCIKSAVQKNKEGFPIFDEHLGREILDGVNTLIYTIINHFIGKPSNITSRIYDQLSNLRCRTLGDYRWYEVVFTTKVMHRSDCNSPFWKEKFINGLPRLFGEKVKETLCNPLGVIDYDNLTHGDISSTIRSEGMKMCRDFKIQSQANKSKAKYEVGTFCTQYGLPPIAPSKRKTRKESPEKPHKRRTSKYYKRKEYNNSKDNDFYKKGKSSRSKEKASEASEKCFRCGKEGHFSKECRSKAKSLINTLISDQTSKNEIFRLLELTHIESNSTGDWVKEREEAVPSQSLAPRPRNSKGTNVPPVASEAVGENEVASRQRNEVPLVEQEVHKDRDEMMERFCAKYYLGEDKVTFQSFQMVRKRSGEDPVQFIKRFEDVSLHCYGDHEENELMETCISNMLFDNRLNLENLCITQFADLLQRTKRTTLTMRTKRVPVP